MSPSEIFTSFEGTSEIQRMIIGRAVTGLNLFGGAEKWRGGSYVGSEGWYGSAATGSRQAG
jgi:hypothetical protein